MWKLIDCGTYPWFVLEKQKYFHCVYGHTGEYKKLKVKRIKYRLYSMNEKMYLAYLKTWNLSEAKCILNKKRAKFFDEEVSKLMINLAKKNKIYLIQQVSNKKIKEELKKNYNEIELENELFEFSDDIYQYYNRVDFAITRAGASTISELTFNNIPFLAIPFPYAKDNHQYYNAKEYYDKNLCWLINENNFDINQLLTLISNLIVKKEELLFKKNNMKKFSYQNIWEAINQKFVGLINEN